MSDSRLVENEFLGQVNAIVEQNIANERFGVSELAGEMNMSRSNLLRKVKKVTKLSVSQLISHVRLKRGLELLRKTSLNVSEVAHQVGFSSASYFIKCFREHYGYPPGEVGKRDEASIQPVPVGKQWYRKIIIPVISVLVIAAVVGFAVYSSLPSGDGKFPEKSIVILPFKNESSDSSNIYLINGLMESTLNNLQKIKDLKVISRTSAEKYRNSSKSIPEMAKELNANYFVEGSGQKIGDRIVLNIQLIDASSDRHLWAKQYRRESKDIFQLQQEIANNITEEIRAIITPEEKIQIAKNPTDNLAAYDLFLKGRDLFYKGTRDNLEKSIPYFKNAVKQDPEFALAYAELTRVYYYLDIFQTDKKYGDEINSCADKAWLYDPKLAESLVAKAMAYMHRKEYEMAAPYLEKALDYNPNSALVINFLSDFYNNYIPNTTKYLEYALKGVRLDIAAHDSVSASYNYLHLSNALIQTGFVDEALENINKSLAYNPDNPYSSWVKVFILYAKNRDLKQARQLLTMELKKDTTKITILEELGKVCYMMRDYQSAYRYYRKFIDLREAQQMDIFKHESLKIAFVLSKLGQVEKAKEFERIFKEIADNDHSIYHHLNLAAYYAYRKEPAKAIEHLTLFSKEDNFQYWVLLMEDDPVVDPIKDLPEFRDLMREIKVRFWDTNKKIRTMLEEKDLL